MGLHRDDREFRHPGVSFLDYKQLDMDRVLTGLLPRLWWRRVAERRDWVADD